MTKLKTLFESAEKRRTNFRNAWTDIAKYFRPNRGDFNSKDAEGTFNDPSKVHTAPLYASKKLASKVTTSLTDLTVNKIKIVPVMEAAQDDEEIQLLASDNTFDMRNLIQHPKLNFANANQSFTEDWCAFGTSVMMLKEVDYFPYMVCQAVHLDNITILENHLGMVDVVFHKIEVSGRQLLQMFSEEVLPVKMYKSALKNPSELVCIYKIAMSAKDAELFTGIKALDDYVVVYTDEGMGDIFHDYSLSYFPYLVSRYSLSTEELYGRSPAWDALPYARRLNVLQRMYADALSRNLKPNVITTDDALLSRGVLRPGQVIEGGIDGVTGQRTFDYVTYPADLRAGRDEENYLVGEIEKMFLVQGLPDNKNVRMTQVEVQARLAELQSLAPNVSRLINEYILPLLTTLYRFWVKKKLLKPKPENALDTPLEFNLTGALANVYRFAEIESIQTMYNLISVIGPIDPSIAQVPKHEEVLRLMTDILNVPTKVLKTKDELQQEKQAQAEAAQQQQALAATQGLSEAGLNAARASQIQGGI